MGTIPTHHPHGPSRGRRTLLAGTLAALLLAAPSALSQDPEQRYFPVCVARDFAALEGSDGTLRLTSQPTPMCMMPDGSVIAVGSIQGPGIDSTNNAVLLLLRHGELPEKLLQERDDIAGGFFRRPIQVTAADNGDLVVVAEVGDIVFPGNQFNGPHFHAVLAGPPDALQVIADARAVDAGRQLSYVRHTTDGYVAFRTRNEIWTWDPAGDGAVVAVGPDSEIPGLDENSTISPTTERLELTAGGNVLFHATQKTIDPAEPEEPPVFTRGLWVGNGSAVSPVVLEGDAVPGWPGFTFGNVFNILYASQSGWLIFNARVTDGSPTIQGDTFAGNIASGFKPVAAPAPDGFQMIDLADDGTVLAFTGAPSAPVLWRSLPAVEIDEASDWIEVTRIGADAPGTAGQFTIFNNIHLAADGTIAFGANFTDNFGRTGVWVGGGSPFTLEPASVPGFTYERDGSVRTITFDDSVLQPNLPDNILPKDFSLSKAGGTLVIRNGRLPYIIDDRCTAVIALDGSGADPVSEATVTMRRLGEASYTPGSIEAGKSDPGAPLVPLLAPLTLTQLPEIDRGLVADGVTPLLFVVTFDAVVNGSTFRASLSGAVPGAALTVFETDGNAAAWVPADTVDLVPENPGDEFFFSLTPVAPAAVPAGTVELDLTFQLVESTLNGATTTIAERPFAVRRPPVGLVSATGADAWTPGFIAAIEARRGDGFAPVLDPGRTVLSRLGLNWAVTRPDWVTHSAGSAPLLATATSTDHMQAAFRNSTNHYRGNWRRWVEIAGSTRANNRLNVFIDALPSWFKQRIPQSVLNLQGGQGQHVDNLVRRVNRDPAAVVHSLATGVSQDPASVPFYRYLNLNTSRLTTLFPFGSDGIIDRNTALHLPGDAAIGQPWNSVFAETTISHATPEHFATQHGQTGSPALAAYILDLLDSPESENRFRSAAKILPSDPAEIDALTPPESMPLDEHRAIRAAATEAAEAVSEAALGIVRLIAAPGKDKADKAETLEFTFETPPGETITGEVLWLAERFGPDGVTTGGFTLATSGENGRDLTLTVADGTTGDIVLYAAYQAGDGTMVYSPPLLASSTAPAGATLTGINVEFPAAALARVLDLSVPDPAADLTALLGGTVNPQVIATYDDGSTAQRFVTADDLAVSSSTPGVLDLQDPTLWTATGAGTTTVTIDAFGHTTQTTIAVLDLFPPLTFDEWKQGFFDAGELADPDVSGAGVDLDNDSLTVFLEYITGGNPHAPDPDLLPQLTSVDGNPALRVHVSNRTTGHTITLQHSPNLDAWDDRFTLSGTPDLGSDLLLEYTENTSQVEVLFDLGNDPATGYFRLATRPAP